MNLDEWEKGDKEMEFYEKWLKEIKSTDTARLVTIKNALQVLQEWEPLSIEVDGWKMNIIRLMIGTELKLRQHKIIPRTWLF